MEPKDLQSIPLFANLTPAEQSALAASMSKQEYALGATIYAPGEQSDALFIILKGSVSIIHALDGDMVTLARLGQGYFFGEAGILKEQQTHQSEARAETDGTVLLKLAQGRFLSLAQKNPALAFAILRRLSAVLSERLTEDTTRIAIISAINELVADPAHLNNISSLAREILAITKRAIPSSAAFLGLYKRHNPSELAIIASANLTPKHLPVALPVDSDPYLRMLHEKNGELIVPSKTYQE
ncbi:MAG: cyclic nucleotide-binding domain-containing protein, partial [bacterium]|nr:cyclic nucleotide-binding domain-containing protein [bacterium]